MSQWCALDGAVHGVCENHKEAEKEHTQPEKEHEHNHFLISSGFI